MADAKSRSVRTMVVRVLRPCAQLVLGGQMGAWCVRAGCACDACKCDARRSPGGARCRNATAAHALPLLACSPAGRLPPSHSRGPRCPGTRSATHVKHAQRRGAGRRRRPGVGGGRRGRRAGRCPPHTPQQKAHPQPRAWIQDLSPDASIASASACSLPATASGMLRRGAVPGRAHEVTGLGRRVVGLLLSGTPPSPAPH